MAEMIIEPIEKYGLSQKDRPKTLFSKIGIVGCGTVGQSLAITASKHGIEVIFLELSGELISHSIEEIKKLLDEEINHWGLTPSEKNAIMSRIKGTLVYDDFRECELVIESIKSNQKDSTLELRKDIFIKIEKAVPRNCIIATNSTTQVITEMSSELEHKDRCVSLHISSTAPGASVIEVVRGLHTSEEAYKRVLKFVRLIEKIAIPVVESPGLISVRLFVVILNEACETYMEGVGSMNCIDATMKACFNMPLGPFEFADKVGLDKIIRWMENLYDEFGSSRYIASPIIKKLVRANRYGRSTGQGFYEYDEAGNKISDISCAE